MDRILDKTAQLLRTLLMSFINIHKKLLQTSLQIPTDNGKYIFVHFLYTRSVISQQFSLFQCNSSKICPNFSTIQENFKHTLSWSPSALDTSRYMGGKGVMYTLQFLSKRQLNLHYMVQNSSGDITRLTPCV